MDVGHRGGLVAGGQPVGAAVVAASTRRRSPYVRIRTVRGHIETHMRLSLALVWQHVLWCFEHAGMLPATLPGRFDRRWKHLERGIQEQELGCRRLGRLIGEPVPVSLSPAWPWSDPAPGLRLDPFEPCLVAKPSMRHLMRWHCQILAGRSCVPSVLSLMGSTA